MIMDVLLLCTMCLIFYHLSAANYLFGKLLFSNGESIMEFDVDSQNVSVLVGLEGSGYVFSMDYDYKNKYIYLTRYVSMDIARFAYPSKNITLQHVVSTSSFPSGVAVDSANDHIYWVNNDRYGDKLWRSNLDGTNAFGVFTSLNQTFMIKLDVPNRWVYIGYFSAISKSRYNLTDYSIIVNFTTTTIAMDIDLTEQRLYWIGNDGDMTSVNVDGSDIQSIFSTNRYNTYYEIFVFGSSIYYADEYQLVMRNKSPSSTSTVLYEGSSDISSIYVFKLPVSGNETQI